jgi:hypothetical protein
MCYLNRYYKCLSFLHRVQIFRYLIEHGGNVAAVNNDAELPLDIAESDEMEDMLQQNINAQGKTCGSCVNHCTVNLHSRTESNRLRT